MLIEVIGKSLELSSVAKTIKRFSVYFADPFASWQRGSNENFNRMVRKFIPKGADISKYTKKEIRQIEEWINNYPRRILNYLSAREAKARNHVEEQGQRFEELSIIDFDSCDNVRELGRC